ncbi:AarF/UbiB family protein [Nocardiopsis sp. RSe5-2]|uniref:AarF/UbiB family protein n=1 Tax=Nocardiopsis endophytica TaxID=3018445 RepID=A0ABT4TXF8_9ACTN|nr:AarF/UbiB family protein [Nocardiopsis endophytica]MDA2809365.1 AarF/UbiB family protein [Nocardiopsis endophytica]
MDLLGLVMLVLFTVVTSALARRTLGVPIGWPRTALVALTVLTFAYGAAIVLVRASGLPFTVEAVQASPAPYMLLAGLAVVWVFLFGLIALVLLELFLPTGTLPPALALVTGWKARRRRARRYARITAIAVKHGLGGYLRGRRRTAPVQGMAKTARSLTAALNEAGVAFIKFGQMLSTRPDLVPEVFTRELSALQTRAEPEPWPRIERAVADALGRPVGEVFASVDPEPLAAASVAQVHAAELHDGTRVVLKVQRPGAQRQVEADMDILLRLGRRLERSTAWGAALGVHRLTEGFADSLEEELDYRVELDNMRAVAAEVDGDRVRVPAVYPEYSSRTLLVMERVGGVPVGDAGPVLDAFTADERREIAERLVGEVLRQISVSGVFHADLHMGNILVARDGALSLLDFGSVGRLDSGARTTLGLLLAAVDRDDAIGATDALVDLLGRPEGLDERRLEREVGQLVLRFRPGLGGRGSAEVFAELFPVVLGHGFSVPPQIAAAFRALTALQGTAAAISPDLDLIQAARRQGRLIAEEAMSGAALRESLEARLMSLLPTLQRLPRRVDRITQDLEEGRFTVTVRPFADPEGQRFLTGLVRQVVLAAMAATAVLGSILLITSDRGPMMAPNVPLYTFVGGVLLFVGCVLALRALVLVFRDDRP